MNKSYFAETKFFVLRAQSKEDASQRQFDRLNQSINDLTRKLETLMLTINALSEKVAQKKQSEYSMIRCLEEAPAPAFSRQYSDDCFRYDVADHMLRYCPEV